MIAAEVTTPWGNFTLKTKLDTIRFGRAQLQYFIDMGLATDPLKTKADIAGYDAVLELGDERTAERFLEVKHRMRRLGESTSNAETIEALKASGKWGSRVIGHGVYLICFDRPFAHAKHYLGWASNIGERIDCHRASGRRCARLIKAVNDAGIGWRVVRVWPGLEKGDERRMKSSGHSRRCPCCKRGTYGPAF
jgi:hypothetical protein